MLSGRRPFRGASPADTLSAILKEEPPDLATSIAGVPASLVRVIRYCLEKSPQARFQAARDVAFALEAASGVLGPAPSSAPSVARASWSRRAALAIAGAALLTVAVFGARPLRERLAGGAAPIRSLVVLPLENLSHDPEQEYFADGMTEELITDLAQIRSLRVISRTSAMAYKGTRKRVPAIGRELEVGAVLEGSVQRSGLRVRITAQLIRAAVTPEERTRLARERRADPRALELVLRGRDALRKSGSEQDLRKAITIFEEARAVDPASAAAYSGLADGCLMLSDFYLPPWETMPNAKEAALRAIELDDTLADAHTSLGLVHFVYDYDWSGAEREFKRALELNPGSAEAHDGYSGYLVAMGRETEGIAEGRWAVSLNPGSYVARPDLGLNLFMCRMYGEASATLRKAIALAPEAGVGHTLLATALAAESRFEEATAEAEQGMRLDESPLNHAVAASVLAKGGKPERARRILGELAANATKRYVCPYEVGVTHVSLGEPVRSAREAPRVPVARTGESLVTDTCVCRGPRAGPRRPSPTASRGQGYGIPARSARIEVSSEVT